MTKKYTGAFYPALTDMEQVGGRAVAVLREWRSEDPFLVGKSFTFMLY